MGLLDAKCTRCGLAFPLDVSAAGTPPQEGRVKEIYPSVFKVAFCCRKCWDESVAAGFDLTEKEEVVRWNSADWSATRTGAVEEQQNLLDADRAATAAKQAQERAALERVKVTTGSAPWPYEIDRVVFNIGASTGILSFLKPSPDLAFRHAEAALKLQAVALNCDAVIHTQFEHRITVTKGAFGPNQGIEVFAYGTAVRRLGGTAVAALQAPDAVPTPGPTCEDCGTRRERDATACANCGCPFGQAPS